MSTPCLSVGNPHWFVRGGLAGGETLCCLLASFLRQSSFCCDSGLTSKPIVFESGMAYGTECCP